MPFSHRLCQVFHCTLFLNTFLQHWVRLRKTGANIPAPVLYSLLISIFISVLLNLNACLPGDPVDLVRQQDQRNPPRRLRWTHQVSRPGIRRLLAFNPSPHSQHFSLNSTNSTGNGMFSASSLNSNEKAENLTLLFATHAQLSVFPTRFLFHSSVWETDQSFLGFSAQNFPAIPTSNCFSILWSPKGPDFQNFSLFDVVASASERNVWP